MIYKSFASLCCVYLGADPIPSVQDAILIPPNPYFRSNYRTSISATALTSSRNCTFTSSKFSIKTFALVLALRLTDPQVFSEEDVCTDVCIDVCIDACIDNPFSTAHSYGHAYHGTVSLQLYYIGCHLLV